jgi:hypothetical protein
MTTVAQVRAAAQQWKLTDSAPVVDSHESWAPAGVHLRDGKVIIIIAPATYCPWSRLRHWLSDLPGEWPVHVELSAGFLVGGTAPVRQVTLIRGKALIMELVR